MRPSRGNREHGVGQDFSVRRDDAEIGVERAERIEKRLVTQPLWLQDRQSKSFRELLYGRRPANDGRAHGRDQAV